LLLAVLTIGAQQYRIPVSEEHEKMQTGKYEPTWQSLETHQTPEWFRNAKFGIWAHWGATLAPITVATDLHLTW